MLEEVVIGKIADVIFEKYRKLKEKEQITIVKFDDDKFSYTELDDSTTTKKEFDKDNPNLSFENPYKRNCKIKHISIIPDDSFQSKGMLEIYIGDELFFTNKKFANFANVSQSNIPLNNGALLKTNESIKIYLKSQDGTEIGLTAQVTFGE